MIGDDGTAQGESHCGVLQMTPTLGQRAMIAAKAGRGGLPETPSDFGCHLSKLIIILAVKPKRIHPVCDGKANGRSDQKIPHQGNY